MKHGFIKVAAACPQVRVADCNANLSEIFRLHAKAEAQGVKLLVYPELALTSATASDLFFTETLLSSAEKALCRFVKKTADSDIISIIGFPLVVNDKIYNAAAICQKGQILGVIPKQNLQREEKRYFSAYCGDTQDIFLCGMQTSFGSCQLFACEELPLFRFSAEIGTDLFSALPPSSSLCSEGALIIANPAATPALVGSEEYQRNIVLSQSSHQACGYIFASSGDGESTTDLVFGGQAIIAENGKLLSERKPFEEGELTVCEIDLSLLSHERRLCTDITAQGGYDVTYFSMEPSDTQLTRKINPHPFVPESQEELAKRCETVLNIQAHGLATRITRAFAKKCVIGISGGLDSTLALIATVKAMELLGRGCEDIICVTMPGFGTTSRTKSNADILCREFGCTYKDICISEAVRVHFSDIGHDEANRNVVYENAQARERTQVLMDIANMEEGMVIGTGDLSELMLGWATYNGDHMSMYGVNSSVPKTLVRQVVSYYADCVEKCNKTTLAKALRDIVDTPVSPELLPADDKGDIAQKTEDLVGPYEIHDFYIYYTLRYGYAPDKLYRIAKLALGDKYDDETLLRWLRNFVKRLFSQQFKRSCLPDGPAIGAIGASPRSTFKMPSDAASNEWIRIVEALK